MFQITNYSFTIFSRALPDLLVMGNSEPKLKLLWRITFKHRPVEKLKILGRDIFIFNKNGAKLPKKFDAKDQHLH